MKKVDALPIEASFCIIQANVRKRKLLCQRFARPSNRVFDDLEKSCQCVVFLLFEIVSLVFRIDWGGRGREFKSRRSDHFQHRNLRARARGFFT